MSAYSTVVVGTDGSDSSYRAVDRAGAIAGAAGAKLIVATAYFPENNPHSADVLKDDAYKVTGKAPVYDILRTARERATAAERAVSRSARSKERRWMRCSTWWSIPRRTCWSWATSA